MAGLQVGWLSVFLTLSSGPAGAHLMRNVVVPDNEPTFFDYQIEVLALRSTEEMSRKCRGISIQSHNKPP